VGSVLGLIVLGLAWELWLPPPRPGGAPLPVPGGTGRPDG